MKRAANQSGAAMPSHMSRRALADQETAQEEAVSDTQSGEAVREVLAQISAEISETIDVEMKAVSNGSSVVAAADAVAVKADAPLSGEKDDPVKQQRREEIKADIKDATKDAAALTGSQNPLQQLQIVRLLTDLGDRLRQSEKEREVLWKELEMCRKQISDMGSNVGKTEKSFHDMESQINQREVFVKELVEKQMGLEQQLKDQMAALETAKQENTKLHDKINSVETAAGSAIVRVEDAIAENSKLAKRVEQLGQDKARLIRKLEVVEETLVQTQDTLKAKALVLLTDQALASRTNLPQTPAWTGDDTLKVSTPSRNAPDNGAAAGPVADLAASLRPKQQTPPMTLMQLAVVVAIVSLLFGSVAIYAFVRLNPLSAKKAVSETTAPVDHATEQLSALATKMDESKNSVDQAKIMSDAAKVANQIEPGNLKDADEVPADADTNNNKASDAPVPDSFQAAQAAQDKAVADFQADAPDPATVTARLKSDKALPKPVADIEAQAFAGDVTAQHDLAAIYTAGQAGVKINYTRASKWFNEAAHHGSANAQYNLAVLYHQGLGVQKNTEKAISLYRVAAANHHPEALYNLAIAYVEGIGVEYNPEIAAVYFERAAQSGVIEAAYNLGLLHENGLLGESQPDEAVFWYSLAADKGNADAIKALKQLKAQLSMSDEDAARVAAKIAASKTGFLSAAGKPALPDLKSGKKDNVTADAKPAPNMVQTPAVSASAPPVAAAPKAPAQTSPAFTADPVVVSQIQEQLVRLGLYKGIPNGTISPALTQSIKTYQQKNALKVDGNPSDDLLVQMLASGAQVKTSGLVQAPSNGGTSLAIVPAIVPATKAAPTNN